METKDIIGKEFTGIEFEGDGTLNFSNDYKRHIGRKGTVIELHSKYPKYAKIDFGNGYKLHFPTELVKEQIDKNTPAENIFIVLSRIEKLTR